MGYKEKLFYKQRPYIYAFLGIGAFAFAQKSKLAFFSGVILLICSYAVFEMRKKYQERQAQIKAMDKAATNAAFAIKKK